MCGGVFVVQRTTLGNQFCFSFTWDSGSELMLSVLAAGICISYTISTPWVMFLCELLWILMKSKHRVEETSQNTFGTAQGRMTGKVVSRGQRQDIFVNGICQCDRENTGVNGDSQDISMSNWLNSIVFYRDR